MFRETWTPQLHLTANQFRTTMNYQGLSDNRDSEADVYKSCINGYIARSPGSPTLLEVGCGLGDMAEHLSKIVGESNYHGIDSNSSFVLEARRRLPNLNFSLQNFFMLLMDAQYDIVCIPYTLINLFSFSRQEILLRKALAHGQMVMVHTMLPDVYGVKENTERELQSDEFGTDYNTMAYFMCEASFRAIFTDLKCSNTRRYDHDVRTTRGTYTYTIMVYER